MHATSRCVVATYFRQQRRRRCAGSWRRLALLEHRSSFSITALARWLTLVAATYGGHLELSAFAHMMRRDVKVIQPGLVYVIEWAAGADADADTEEDNTASTSSVPQRSAEAVESSGSQREKRRAVRERKRAEKERERLPPPPQPSEDDNPPGPVYVA